MKEKESKILEFILKYNPSVVMKEVVSFNLPDYEDADYEVVFNVCERDYALPYDNLSKIVEKKCLVNVEAFDKWYNDQLNVIWVY